MPTYYDDNYGHWDINDEDDLAFYKRVQKENVWKTCERCGARVKLRPDYGICNTCADAIERGFEY